MTPNSAIPAHSYAQRVVLLQTTLMRLVRKWWESVLHFACLFKTKENWDSRCILSKSFQKEREIELNRGKRDKVKQIVILMK